MSYITLAADPGEHVLKVAQDAVRLATILKIDVRFRFNGVDLYASRGDDPYAIAGMYKCETRGARSDLSLPPLG